MSLGGSVLGPVLFSIITNDISSGISMAVDCTNLRGAADKMEGKDPIQRDKLEKRAHVNLAKLSKSKGKVLYLAWGNTRFVSRLGEQLFQSSPKRRTWGS